MGARTRRVYIETYGCTTNQADSDIMRGVLAKHFRLASSVDEADVVVVNTCGVISFTERKILRRLRELKESGKTVVAAGCLTRIARKEMEKIADAVISPDNVHLVDSAVISALKGEKPVLIRVSSTDKAALHATKCRKRENAISIVSISEGCLGRCSYCATKIARGRLRSFSLEKIVEEVRRAVADGFREIQLTSQDTGAYGMDRRGGKDYRLPDLLNAISELDGDFRVRVGMMNPQHAVEILDDLLNAFESEKIYKFLHIPVQSGDNRVLADMKRDHTVEDFLEVVNAFRSRFDDVMISTDIIVGFPTESEESFWKSYQLIEEVRPDIVNITRFSPRRGTAAYRLKDMPDWIKKERSRILTKLCEEIGLENHRKFVGRVERVLVTKKGKNNTMLARTDAYRPVVLKEGELGEFYLVKVVDATFNYLVGDGVRVLAC